MAKKNTVVQPSTQDLVAQAKARQQDQATKAAAQEVQHLIATGAAPSTPVTEVHTGSMPEDSSKTTIPSVILLGANGGFIPGTDAVCRATNGRPTTAFNMGTVMRGLVYAGWSNGAIYTYATEHHTLSQADGLKPSYPSWYRSQLSGLARKGKLVADLPVEYQTNATSRQAPGTSGTGSTAGTPSGSTLEQQAQYFAAQAAKLAAECVAKVAQIAAQQTALVAESAALHQAHAAYCAAMGVAVDQASPVQPRLVMLGKQVTTLADQQTRLQAEYTGKVQVAEHQASALQAAWAAYQLAMVPPTAEHASTVEA